MAPEEEDVADAGLAVLERAAGLLRLPGSDAAPAVDPTLPGLRLPDGGRAVPLRAGVLDLLGEDFAPTPTQRALDTPLAAGLYDRIRDAAAPWIGMPRFPDEVDEVVERLALERGDTVLDLACGHRRAGAPRRRRRAGRRHRHRALDAPARGRARALEAKGFADAAWRMSGPLFGRAWARDPS
ncbi:MAG TPA: hypothetical protein VMH82_09920 [Myxococcota bacterium]|nr:hypothetical protein [Myxococcota bacterium]